MAKASGTIDLKSMKKAHDDASKTATDYLHFDSQTGLDVGDNSSLAKVNIKSNTGVSIYDEEGNVRNVVDSVGMAVKDASGNDVAKFGESIQLGEDNNSHSIVDYHSMQLIDKNGNSYLHISDLRDKAGYVTLVESFEGNGTKTIFVVQFSIEEVISAVDSSNPSNTYEVVGKWLYFDTAPANGATVTVTYKTKDDAKAFTIGTRKENSIIGAYSTSLGKDNQSSFHYAVAEGLETVSDGFATHAEGYETLADTTYSHAEGRKSKATGSCSHAEGYNTKASGENSHAEGYETTANGYCSHSQNGETIASSDYQTAIGCGNIEDVDGKYLFIIGNQKGLQNRSNALTVDWDGGLQCGNIKCGVLNDRCNANAMRNISVSFTSPFPSGANPCVIASFAGGYGSSTFGNVQLSVASRNESGFTIRIYNATNSAIDVYIHWIATTSGQQ